MNMPVDNIMLVNAVAITVMAIFGIWVFYRSARPRHPRDETHKDG